MKTQQNPENAPAVLAHRLTRSLAHSPVGSAPFGSCFSCGTAFTPHLALTVCDGCARKYFQGVTPYHAVLAHLLTRSPAYFPALPPSQKRDEAMDAADGFVGIPIGGCFQ